MPLKGEYEPSSAKWVRDQVERYEATGGREANTLRDTGQPIIILGTRGAKTGKVRKQGLMRVEHDGVYALVGSQGGAPTDPGWFIRPSEHRPKASWTWIIAITAGDAKTRRISAQWISGSSIPRRDNAAPTSARCAGVIDEYQPRIVSESCVPV